MGREYGQGYLDKGILARVYGQWCMGKGIWAWACGQGLLGKNILARRYGQGHILMLRVFNSPCTKSGGDLLVKGHLWWKGNMGKGIWVRVYGQWYMGKGIWARAWARTSWLGHMGKGIP